ncbi:MAG: DUF1778 domain-containing protein [bacterium]
MRVHPRRRDSGSHDGSAGPRLFRLDTDPFKRFAAALDAPPSDSPRLRRLLAKKAAWER